MSGRGKMSEVDSDLLILDKKLMDYVNAGMENAIDLAHNTAEYCNDDDNLKMMIQNVMRDFIQMESDIKQTVSALNHVKLEGTRGKEQNLLQTFKDKLEQLQGFEDSNLTSHPKYVEMEEKMCTSEDELLRSLRDVLLGSKGDDDVLLTQSEVNIKCPYTGKTMVNPVRNILCNHVYELEGIAEYIKARNIKARCPVGGCGNNTPITAENLKEHKDMKRYIALLSKKK